MSRALYLIDSYAFIYRSYFAFVNRPLRNPSGANVSAAFGYFRFLYALFDERNPGAVAAVFDSRGKTFRHDMYGEYKATRQKTPEELIAQVPLVEEILGSLGMPVLRMEGYEADDVIASLARRCAREGRECWIVSADKDLLQLVGGSVRALRPGEGFAYRSFGVDEVRAEWGVGPDRILDYLSLTGDASDNVPGVPGIGDKTALKLLLQYDGIDEIYTNLETVKPEGVRRKLESGRESAFLSRKLITLADSLETGIGDLDSLAVDRLDFAAANELFLREGMKSLVRGGGSGRGTSDARGAAAAGDDTRGSGTPGSNFPGKTAKSRPADSVPSLFDPPAIDGETVSGPGFPGTAAHFLEAALPGAAAPGSGVRIPASPPLPSVTTTESRDQSVPGLSPELSGDGRYESLTELPRLAAWVDFCIAAGVYAFDCETDSLDELEARLVGFSLSYTPKEACYVPLVSPDATCIPADAALAQLSRLFASGALAVGHNIKYDYHIMRRSGAPLGERLFDTMIAAWILDAESGVFGLEALAENRLGYHGIAFADIVPKGSTFASVPIAAATRYAAEDADLTLRLHRLFSAELASAGLERLLMTLEMPLVPILAAMEERGIAVRPDKLREFGRELEHELDLIRKEIVLLVGHEFNIASTKQLQEVLFIERKLPSGKKTKTGFSTDISVLEELAALDPVPAKILRHRTLAKLKSTYVDTLAELAEKGEEAEELKAGGLEGGGRMRFGRVHTHYMQTGAATGRLASRDPNLQNIPVRDEEGRRIRAAFVAGPGQLLVSADYSQIELVVLAHLSGDPGLRAAFRDGVDVHRRTASLIFGIPEDQVPADRRRVAKTINFGVIYGMSAFRLARDLGVSRTEAQSFIDAYFKTYSGVLDFIQTTIAETERTGYATTILGRRRLVTAINSRNKTEKSGAERIAVNTPIQGSAADIVKLAMIRVDGAIRAERPEARLLLQVHDELILETPEEFAEMTATIVRREMEGAMTLDLPLRVGMETARSWGDIH